jgi:hypothetical protein
MITNCVDCGANCEDVWVLGKGYLCDACMTKRLIEDENKQKAKNISNQTSNRETGKGTI